MVQAPPRSRETIRTRANWIVEDSDTHTVSEPRSYWVLPLTDRTTGRGLETCQVPVDIGKRLENANRYFRRKAAAVFNDETAMHLLDSMYSQVVIGTEKFDFCRNGRALAKLTAANFCEIGANSVYITEPGQNFVDNIKEQGGSMSSREPNVR